MLEYAAKMTRDHHRATQEDVQTLRGVGFTDADILHIIFWVAHFNMANTLTDCLGLEYHENTSAIFVDASGAHHHVADTASASVQPELVRPGWERPRIHALEGLPLEWINSPPLIWTDLRGRVLLVAYWDATHPNSLLMVPHLQRWHESKASLGLTILACHTPEFPQAKDPDWAREEMKRLGITYPIVLDPTFRKVAGANNRFWPAIQLIDRGGFLRFRHHGPGGWEMIEERVRSLLAEEEERDQSFSALPAQDHANPWLHPKATPDLFGTFYLGSRDEAVALPNVVNRFAIPEVRNPHRLYIAGEWFTGDDGLRLIGGVGSLTFRYSAARVYLFASPDEHPVTFKVQIDGVPVDPRQAGSDLTSSSTVVVDRSRLYWIISHGGLESHEFVIETQDPGVRVHRFSFLPFRGTEDDT